MAGILWLCVGLLVMLKNNKAIELYATNGAKAKVIYWNCYKLSNDKLLLNTLFVKLINLPELVDLPGLSQNVISIVSSLHSINF